MDESWRMRMGTSHTNSGHQSRTKTPEELEPEDFDDVYGGPPRSVLSRKHSGEFTNAEYIYGDIFRQMSPEMENLSGRRLPEFVIPARQRKLEGWTGRSIWSKSKGKSMVKSKSTSSSCSSFDREDVALSSFTSKLRPINVPGKWCSSSGSLTNNKKQELPPFGSILRTNGPGAKDNHDGNYDCNPYMLKDINYGITQRSSSLEIFNVGPAPSLGVSVMDEYDMLQLEESPSSAVSSSSRHRTIGFNSEHEVICMSSWTPEVKVINSETVLDINEAIAWAKEKFQG